MENSDLMARATSRMKKILSEPEIQGDQKKALHAACAIIEIILDQVGKEIDSLLPPREAISIPRQPQPKRPKGRPKSQGNPLRYPVKNTGVIAAIWAKQKGITNAKIAAREYLDLHLDDDVVPDENLVSNLQRRISDARRDLNL